MSHININEALFWTQVYDLAPKARNEYVCGQIDNALEHIEEIDIKAGEVEWSKFMHVRFKLNITKSF